MSAPEGGVEVAIQRTDLRAPTAVTFAIRNEQAAPIYVPTCGPNVLPSLERWQGDHWENAAAAMCLASLSMVPAEILPGEIVQGEISIAAAGQYRVVMQYGGSPRQMADSAHSAAVLIE